MKQNKLFIKTGGGPKRKCTLHKNVLFFTLVLGLMMVSPFLLMAIRTISGKLGSDVCWKENTSSQVRDKHFLLLLCAVVRRERLIRKPPGQPSRPQIAGGVGARAAFADTHSPSPRKTHSRTWASGTAPSGRPASPRRRSYDLVYCKRRWCSENHKDASIYVLKRVHVRLIIVRPSGYFPETRDGHDISRTMATLFLWAT